MSNEIQELHALIKVLREALKPFAKAEKGFGRGVSPIDFSLAREAISSHHLTKLMEVEKAKDEVVCLAYRIKDGKSWTMAELSESLDRLTQLMKDEHE